MVIVTTILDHRTTAELLEEEIDHSSGDCGLGHRELMLDLPAESTTRVPNHRDREAAFTVDKADDPLLNTWPFLLIVRTGWIVTAPGPYDHWERVPPDTRVFQHIVRFYNGQSRNSPL